jgi:hypothetical protein
MIKYLKSTEDPPLILAADNSYCLYLYAGSAFGVHADMKSHTGGGLTLGQGFVLNVSTGQKLNLGSLTIAELIAVSDMLPEVQCLCIFALVQGVPVNRNIIYQDNTLSILLEVSGKKSSGKRTRHINIRYFLITDAVEKKECEIVWILREGMYADYMTKTQSGAKFCRMRKFIIGANPT